LTKFDNFIRNQFQTIVKKCEDESIDANVKIKKLGKVFLNAQQMNYPQTLLTSKHNN
jgi:hypothetical protein